jgi:hypothetical protein
MHGAPAAAGEEPLFTQEVELVPSPVFSAHAQHTVLLAPGQALADCLADHGSGPAEQQQLGFEVRRISQVYIIPLIT